MIDRVLRWNMAILAIMVGVAFFLSGCQPKLPVKKDYMEEATLSLFALAEAYWQKGEFDRALKAYGVYLKKDPRARKAGLALHRMAEICLRGGQYEKALSLFKRVPKEYPDYSELPVVRYQIANVLNLLGDYRRSKRAVIQWQGNYPQHPLKGDILLLLGKNCKALGDNPLAFYWWVEAKKYLGGQAGQEEVKERLDELIQTSDVEEIEQLAIYAVDSDYLPKLYYKMAAEYLQQGELERAQKAAMSLIRSTPEISWISLGRELLQRIQKEMSVRIEVVGCLLPLSGPFAIYGEDVLNGIQLGMGLSGEPDMGVDLELVIKDTEGHAEKAVARLEDLVNNEKVAAIIGPLSSRAAMAAAVKAQELGVPIITLTQKEGVTEVGNMVFRNALTPSREVKRLVDTAIEEMGIKRFGILYPDNSYGHFLMNIFWDRLEEMGGMVTAVESYGPDDTDFAVQIKKMTGLYYPKPELLVQKEREMWTMEEEESRLDIEEPEPTVDFDAVFIPDKLQTVAMIAPQLIYHDVPGLLLMGTSLWQSPELIEMPGDYIQGAIFSSGFFYGTGEPRIKAFVKGYKADFGSAPGILAATGYDTISLLKSVIGQDNIRTRRDVQKTLLKCKDFVGVTGKISFDSRGDLEKEPLLLTIKYRRGQTLTIQEISNKEEW